MKKERDREEEVDREEEGEEREMMIDTKWVRNFWLPNILKKFETFQNKNSKNPIKKEII